MKKLLVTVIALLLCSVAVSPLRGGQDNPPGEKAISDKALKLVDYEDLTYPPVGRTAHVEGVVVIRAKLNDQGKVTDAVAISGNEVLIPASIENAKRWRFQPNSERAAIIVYNFRLTSGVSKSGCSHFMLDPPNFATVTSCVPTIQ
jgi:hypothetical protein